MYIHISNPATMAMAMVIMMTLTVMTNGNYDDEDDVGNDDDNNGFTVGLFYTKYIPPQYPKTLKILFEFASWIHMLINIVMRLYAK